MSKNMWMVRAGRSAFLVQDFEDNEYVAVGWERLGDLSSISSKPELEKLHREAYPEQKPAKRGISLGQIARFRFEIEKGDLVITYNPEFRTYPVGEIISGYEYKLNSPGNFNHIRRVKWVGKVRCHQLSRMQCSILN